MLEQKTMRLAFSTLGCPEWDFETTVSQAAALGFQAIEIRGIQDELQTERLACFQPENREKTRKLLKQNAVSICGIGTSAAFHDVSRCDGAIREGKAAIDICTGMGISFIRVFGDAFPAGENREDVIRRVSEGIGELCSHAEEQKERNSAVQVLLEVHGDFNTIEALSGVAAQLQEHTSFGLIWDVEHSFRAYGEDYMGFYQALKGYIRHIHIKDCRMEKDTPVCLLPGEGDVPLGNIVRILQTEGYGGFYSFEWEKRWQPGLAGPDIAFPHYVKYMRDVAGRNSL